eukprot:6195490-Pleurochrysis_carterae.AAC.1
MDGGVRSRTTPCVGISGSKITRLPFTQYTRQEEACSEPAAPGWYRRSVSKQCTSNSRTLSAGQARFSAPGRPCGRMQQGA